MSSYKHETVKGVVADISSAFGDLEELASECREIVDNASEGLSQTQRIQTFDSTASDLENCSEPEVPEGFGDTAISYGYSVNKNKRRGPSRAVRAGNIAAVFHAAAEAAQDRAQTLEDEAKNVRDVEAPEEVDDAKADALDEQADALRTFADECEDIASTLENAEFPGMYG